MNGPSASRTVGLLRVLFFTLCVNSDTASATAVVATGKTGKRRTLIALGLANFRQSNLENELTVSC